MRQLLCQGMTSVVPQPRQNEFGFSRRGNVFEQFMR